MPTLQGLSLCEKKLNALRMHATLPKRLSLLDNKCYI